MKKIHLISNAHIDPVWQWEWQEGVGATITTFSAAADFCEEFDQYVFCHNESLLYEWVEKFDYPLFERIQRLVKEGKWHIMGGWYIQPDCNMISGESFIRHILKGLNYFEQKFENFKRPTTAINFDSFGHSRGLVQILNDAGYDSYIVSRPSTKESEINMIWKGFNKSQVIVARVSDGYNSLLGQVDKKLIPFLSKPEEIRNELFLWGVGNHGGGPSRQDYQIIKDIQKKYPNIEFIHSTPEDYFKEVKKYEHELKETDDLNHVNMGCYTSQVRIKQLHARLENELYSAEKMAAHAHMNGMQYPIDALKRAEEDLLFSQFHDILPGSDIKEAEETSLRTLGHGLEETDKVKLQSFFALTKGQPKADQGEYPVFAYNPHPYKIRVVIEAEFMLADQNWSLTDFYDIEVYHHGKKIDSQLEKESSDLPLDWRKKVVFEAELDPFSVERFSCYTVSKPVVNHVRKQKYEFDNGRLFVKIDKDTGLIHQITIDKHPFLDGSIEFQIVENSCDPWGFFYDDYKKVFGQFKLMEKADVLKFTDVKNGNNINIIEDGDIRTVVQTFLKYNDSKMVVNYTIPKHGTDLKIDIKLLNQERDIKLKMHVPTTIKSKHYYGKTAYGVNELVADGNEKVAHDYVMIKSQNKALGIINFGNHGSDSIDGAINQTLINSSAYCAHPINDREILETDRYNNRIDLGERQFSFIICSGDANDVTEEIGFKSMMLHEKPYVMNYFPTGTGTKPQPFLNIENKQISLSAFKKAESQNGYIIRLFNTSAQRQNTKVNITNMGLSLEIDLNGYEFQSYLIDEQGVHRVNCLEKSLE